MPLPLITIAQMREWEKATWATGQTEAEVIRRVGEKIAARALQLTRPGDLILLLAGKGHNGDDVRAARPHLADRRVELLEVADPEAARPILDQTLAQKPALVVDGLFGIGLNRALAEPWIKFIHTLNQAQAFVLAVDVPSGLNADTGEPLGAAIEAAITLTIGAPKTGLLQPAAWPFVNRLEVVVDVGLSPCPWQSESYWILREDFAGLPPRRLAASHKSSYGHLAIIAGSVGFHGAAVLAARAAQRAQPGLITLYPHEPAYHPVAAQLQAVMVSPWSANAKLPGNHSAILIGPGLAAPGLLDEMSAHTRRIWRDAQAPVIVDASALDWLRLDPGPNNAIRVITPHPGEAARLLKTTPQQIQANRQQSLRELSRRLGNCWVILKGHQTLIGRHTGEIRVNSSGNPHLAQGGSGDTLAGFLAGLLAQAAWQKDVFRTLAYAVWQHGDAADRLQSRSPNWVVEDLPAGLGNFDL